MNEILCNSCELKFDNTELIQLQTCDHNFCLTCLQNYLTENIRSHIECPVVNCQTYISDNIIRRILNAEQTENYQIMCSSYIPNLYHCILCECSMILELENSNFHYECHFCTLFNCVKCNEAHSFISCEEFNLFRDTIGREACENELNRARKVFDIKMRQERRASIAEVVRHGILPNPDIFNCPICRSIIEKGDGILLRNCFHNICKICLKGYVIGTSDIPTACPIDNCDFKLCDSESRALLNSEEMKLYDMQILDLATQKFYKTGYCSKPDCPCIVEITGNLSQWTCTLCKSVNCYKCQAIHNGESCREYRTLHAKEMKEIEKMIKDKILMRCPVCRKLLHKIGGCNFVKCDRCGAELCWIRQMARWGPGGRGDQTGGCKCGLDGKRCHRDCYPGCIPDGQVTYFPRHPNYFQENPKTFLRQICYLL